MNSQLISFAIHKLSIGLKVKCAFLNDAHGRMLVRNSDQLAIRCSYVHETTVLMNHESISLTLLSHSISMHMYTVYVLAQQKKSMYVHTYVCMYAHTYECTHIRTHVCTYVCKYECTHIRMNVHEYVCMYVHTYVRTYVCMHVCTI